MEKIRGTWCELCTSRVKFNGEWVCTRRRCDFTASAWDCDLFYFDETSCGTCPRRLNCAFESGKTPLAYAD